ncbi:MAG TPA: hypothetical protein VF086_12680 [Propionibacteriaceae bacterium]
MGKKRPSECVVRGSIQIPPGGEPVVFLADHPATGGYPVVAVVVDEAMDQAAQAVPGRRFGSLWRRRQARNCRYVAIR